jgi:hypothetical protein
MSVERDLLRLEIDFEKSTPFAEWQYVEVEFPFADKDVVIRHHVGGSSDEIFILPVRWHFAAAPATVPQIYFIEGVDHHHAGYCKVRATVAGKALVLVARKRKA